MPYWVSMTTWADETFEPVTEETSRGVRAETVEATRRSSSIESVESVDVMSMDRIAPVIVKVPADGKGEESHTDSMCVSAR